MMDNYEVKIYSGYHMKNKNPSYLARMQGQLIKAINDRKFLPKAIVVVIKDDLIFDAEFDDAGAATIYKENLCWLVTELVECVKYYHSILPTKAKRAPGYTKFLWIAAPHHDSFNNNALHKKFNSVLYAAVAVQDSMNTIKLKGYWDTQNFRLVNKGKITGEGLFRYWEAVDLGFKFWLEVMLRQPPRGFTAPNSGICKGKFNNRKPHWSNQCTPKSAAQKSEVRHTLPKLKDI